MATGNPLYIYDNDNNSIISIEAIDSSGFHILNAEKSIIKRDRTFHRNGITISNDARGEIVISGVLEDTSAFSCMYDGLSFYSWNVNSAGTLFIGDGNIKKFSVALYKDTKSNYSIAFGIKNLNNNEQQVFLNKNFEAKTGRDSDDPVYGNYGSDYTYQTIKDAPYTVFIIITPTSGASINDDIGLLHMGIVFGDATDELRTYYTRSKHNTAILPYNKNILYFDNNNVNAVAYYQNIAKCDEFQFAKFRTISSVKRACSNLITDYDGQNAILFDLSDESANNRVLSAASQFTVRAIVISHFHWDHIGSSSNSTYPTEFYRKLAAKLPDDAVCYIQQRPPQTSNASWLSMWDNAKYALEEAGINVQIVPYEGYQIKIGEFVITFTNVDISSYDDNGFGGYNNTSLCAYVDYHGSTIFVTGDAYAHAEETMHENGYLKHADLLQAPHHGLMTKISRGFMTDVSPNIIITNFGTSKDQSINQENLLARSYTSSIASYLYNTSTEIYDVYENDTFDIIVKNDGLIETRYLIPFTTDSKMTIYSNISDAISEEIPYGTSAESETSSTLTLHNLLIKMPRNSEIHCILYLTYQIGLDIFGELQSDDSNKIANLIVKKLVGGHSNNIFNRPAAVNYSDIRETGDFLYYVEATVVEESPRIKHIIGRFKNSSDNQWQQEYEY